MNRVSVICKLAMNCLFNLVLRGRDPFGQKTGIATSGQVQHRKSAIHGLPVTLRMPRVKSDKSDWFWSQSIVFTKPFKTRMSLDLARGTDFQRMTKGTPGDEVGVSLKGPPARAFALPFRVLSGKRSVSVSVSV